MSRAEPGWADLPTFALCPPHSNEAADYDLKHEKASAEIVKRVQARRDFIGVQWIEDDDDDDDDDDEDDEIPDEEESTRGKKEPTSEAARRSVRLLDYACGTGAMSRVRCVMHLFPRYCGLFPLEVLPHARGSTQLTAYPLWETSRRWHRTRRNALALISQRRWWRPITPVLRTK